ncbi:acetolactate synthase small subunit [Helicobacter winghamensis]|uniref:Acetolactate synthase small subunit n=1 Tax=Helicobacter winghamensis TaxID=157268 RepID=A0A2N3PKZ1_9HELI|nr:acetolactate synthase small subunit [Helicobacter winghamensis]EEO26778.1 acetolactate synthase, small subunit [Helicobacter winghamensis ATCC BAA-430]PKT79127.1 acetolactate synthase small subunit [Helicobacter winghamensis]PKT79191.1 acetolactate synthase small subunit [Helicobacter winghamensis]PKT79279.1 acetolactate synthase small subunit [Helicobacter winghamensis]PKT82345.1 acetolactate synthase small subunit [Helicobacter winghamensis]
MEIKRTITVTVLNEHGVLSRISGLFAGRGYNIESLTVAPILDSNLSRITIATKGDNKVLEQIIKQLHKLIPVLKVLEDEQIIEQESLLAKFGIEGNLSAINTLFNGFNGRLLEANDKYAIFVACDTHTRINTLLNALKIHKPKDITRSGILAIESNN